MLKKEKALLENEARSGISIIVCAHNNCIGLQTLIPLLTSQDYALFELIIVNDRSKDETETWLETQCHAIHNLKVITINQTPPDWNAKKYALQQGIKAAKYPLLALTDSDCKPLSDQWLKHINASFQHPNTNIFVGYSPYTHQKGILNGIIRTETLFTAFQYISLAKLGMAYMGVGRNLAYRKSFLEKHLDQFPFQNHIGGDDDLLINSLSTGKDAQTCLSWDSFIESEPKTTWQSWWQQKRRHLSAGQKYKFSTQLLLASYWFSSLGFWTLFIALCFIHTDFYMILAFHSLFLSVGTFILKPIFRIFQEGRLLWLFPFWDFLYIASSSIIGLSTFGIKNKRWS